MSSWVRYGGGKKIFDDQEAIYQREEISRALHHPPSLAGGFENVQPLY